MRSRHVIRFPGTLAGFAEGTRALHLLLDEHQMAASARYHIELAFEEIAVNIVRHSAPVEDIEVALAFDDGEVVLTFEDDGAAFNPLEVQPPAVPSSLDEAQVGGLGLMLVRRVSTRMEYERTAAQHNRLAIAISTP